MHIIHNCTLCEHICTHMKSLLNMARSNGETTESPPEELLIMFIYDTERCTTENDDPQDAVVYFYPSWVSDNDRLALVGQLMGATQFFLSAFSCPRIISLNIGKFILHHSGRYILAVGSDCNIQDCVLEYKSTILIELLYFYHRDLNTISESVGNCKEEFTSKLNTIFQIYLPIVHYASNLFETIPSVRLPKSASNVFLEAAQILQSCQESKGVLGGAVLYQNRVVTTQLSAAMTKKLVSTDPHRIKPVAEYVATSFHLPVGVQLLFIYIDGAEHSELVKTSEKKRLAIQNVLERKKNQSKLRIPRLPQTPKEPPPTMKRDTSRIFTVPEEGECEAEHSDETSLLSKVIPSPVPEHCPENSNTFVVKSVSETLSSDLQKVLHADVMSICKAESVKPEKQVSQENSKKSSSFDRTDMKFKNSLDTENVFLELFEHRSHSSSLNDLRLSSNKVPMKCFSFGLPKITRNILKDHESDSSPTQNIFLDKHFFNTIADPLFPVFRSDGLPVSQSLFNEYLAQHYELLDAKRSLVSSPHQSDFSEKCLPKSDSSVSEVSSKKENMKDNNGHNKNDENINVSLPPAKQEACRRSLSLPLKSVLSSDSDGTEKSASFCTDLSESSSVRSRTLGSLQLTPLMTRLSLLAMEEESSGFCSRATTPGEFSSSFDFQRRRSIEKKNTTEENLENHNEKPLQKIVLFVFGQQDMTLLLLLDEETAQDPELILSLWQLSQDNLSLLQGHLHQCLDHFSQGESAEPYSFLCVDPHWDMTQRSGSWDTPELEIVACIHGDFNQHSDVTEVIIRCEDCTLYGYRCGQCEVFYQQATENCIGLPNPSDMMGTIPLKARRRLERDHGIVLL